MRPMSLSGTLACTSRPEASCTIEALLAPAVADAAVVGVTNDPGSAKRFVIVPANGARTTRSLKSCLVCSRRCSATFSWATLLL